MGKWRLVKLLMCSAKYQRLTTEDYIRLGLCPPDTDAGTDSGHYVKNDKMVSWTLGHVMFTLSTCQLHFTAKNIFIWFSQIFLRWSKVKLLYHAMLETRPCSQPWC